VVGKRKSQISTSPAHVKKRRKGSVGEWKKKKKNENYIVFPTLYNCNGYNIIITMWKKKKNKVLFWGGGRRVAHEN
jgi:hypothetical protein